MALNKRLDEDMKQAMRNKEKDRLSVIRMIKASIQNESIEKGVDVLTEGDEIAVLSRELKQRTDSLQQFKDADRDDLVEQLEKEIVIVKQYMPEQLTDEEVEEIVQETIEQLQATSKKDFGKVMGAVMQQVKGQADGTIVREAVQRLLT